MGAVGLPDIHEDRSVRLTKRELEVLCLVVEGKSSKDVADALLREQANGGLPLGQHI